MHLFLPRENYEFPTFTSRFDRQAVYAQLREKCQAFRLTIAPLDRTLNTTSHKANSTSVDVGRTSFRKLVDPFSKGKNIAKYTQHFHREYNHYYASHIAPSIVP